MSSLVRWPVPQPARQVGSASRIITPPAAAAGGTTPPVFETASTLAGATAANASVPVPSGVVADDVVIVAFYLEPSVTVTPPDGTWTEKATIATSATRLRVYWHRATGNESGTYAFTHASTFREAYALRISGAITSGDPFDDFDIQFSDAGGTTTPAVTVDTTVDNTLQVFIATQINGGDNWTPPSALGGFTERHDTASGTTATVADATAGSTGSVTATLPTSGELTAFLGALKPVPVSGGQTIAVGQAVETETAQPVGRLKVKAASQATETETVQAVTVRKSVALAQVTETETAQPVGRAKVKAAGQAVETETAQPVGRLKTVTVGQAVEVEQATEITAVGVLGQAVETETAQPVGRAKIKAAAQATETETAQVVTVRKTVTVGQAVETETAQAVGKAKVKAASQAVETEVAQPIGRRKTVAVGQAVEPELAQAIQPLGDKIIPVGQAIEVEAAQPVGRVKARTVGQAIETELAQAVGRRKVTALGQALEVELAQAITIPPPVPPPRWVEGASSSSGLVEAVTSGSGQIELVGAGIGIVEGSGGV